MGSVHDMVRGALLLLVLLNPFALSVYLIGLFKEQSFRSFAHTLARASAISGVVFILFAFVGQSLFTEVLQVRFAAFQVFGGLVFLLIGLRFMLGGGEALVQLRGEPAQIAGAVAMPFMIGPGSISAAIAIGTRLPRYGALIAVGGALVATVTTLLALKVAFDHVKRQNEGLVTRYVEVASRVSALVAGTIAVEMIFTGLETWLKKS